ncbi:hypothetical protein [Virgisporangium ochraceum]|jgi:hypothetical protein|uniref:hypothetical protein n=1 Tax=Virgisporangium ochraceum TaxID=65505 RepID=UPI0019436725|nr:hypothetical protein [Virgisporangium ochraceum]
MSSVISSLEQARRRRQLNRQIRDLIAVRRAVGRQASADVPPVTSPDAPAA